MHFYFSENFIVFQQEVFKIPQQTKHFYSSICLLSGATSRKPDTCQTNLCNPFARLDFVKGRALCKKGPRKSLATLMEP